MTTTKQVPACIGFIMDGNRRWAVKNGKAKIEGHAEGYAKLKEILGWVRDAGITHAIAFAFSTENWKRTEEEVGALMRLLAFALSNEIGSLARQGVRLKFAGDMSLFSKQVQATMHAAELETADNGPLTLTVALSYGGRAEILQAVKGVARLTKDEIANITEESFKKYLWTGDMPDPDLIIRTGGELRLSNFLPYQSTYSELFFTKTLWPDFTREEFASMLKEYAERKRNHGK